MYEKSLNPTPQETPDDAQSEWERLTSNPGSDVPEFVPPTSGDSPEDDSAPVESNGAMNGDTWIGPDGIIHREKEESDTGETTGATSPDSTPPSAESEN